MKTTLILAAMILTVNLCDNFASAQKFQRVYGIDQGLKVNAGHGLHYHNVQPIAALPDISELNIGHAIVAHALFTGFERAVREMKTLLLAARK